MNTVIKLIEAVPEDLMANCLEEISSLNWESPLVPDHRRLAGIFKTSQSIHIRIHENPESTPNTIEAKSQIINCIDTIYRKKLNQTNKLVNWVFDRVNGIEMGRIMLVNLLPGGIVPNHIDAGKYFESYKRFHVPLITDTRTVFTGSNDGNNYHLPYGILGVLNNGNTHGIRNDSDVGRIHLIADISTNNTEFNFV